MSGKPLLRSHHALFWVASFLVCVIAYGDVVFAHKTFVPVGFVQGTYGNWPFAAGYAGRPARIFPEVDAGAEAWFVHPLAYQERRALLAGEPPLWNPHMGLGSALLPDGQTATLNPLHWIELLNPDRTSLWDLHFLLLRFLAALFSCYLLRRLGAPPAVAVLGAPIAALHGSFTALVSRADLNAYALMPALLYCTVRLRQELDAGSAIAFAVAVYFVVTAGHPQPVASVLVASGLIAAGLLFWPRAPGVARYLALLATAGSIAAAVSAPYWLPFLANLPRSWTSHPPGLGLSAAPVWWLLQWIVPGAFARTAWDAFLDTPLPAQTFVGGIAGALAVLGLAAPLFFERARRWAVFTAVPLVLGLKIFGFPPLRWLGELPLLSRMSFWYFGFAVTWLLALCGVAALADLPAVSPRRRLVACALPVLAVVALLALAPSYAPPPSVPGGLYRHFPGQAALYAVLAIVAMALAYAQAAVPRLRNAMLAALGVVTALELWSYRYELSERGNPTAVAPFVAALQHQQRTSRPFRVMGFGDWLNPNLSTAFALDDVRICDALVSPEYMTFIRRYLQKDLLYGWFLHASPHQEGFRIPEGILNLLNVRYVVSFPNGIEDYIARNRVVYSDAAMQGGLIVENLHAWQRIFAVQDPHIEASADAALERVGALDATKPFAVVAADFPRERWTAMCGPGCGSGALHQRVDDIHYGINDLEFRVSVDGPAVLVVSDSYADGWRAIVDGAEQPIFRANYLFRGLIVGRGDHAVRFVYRPPGWSTSLWLAALGLAASAAFFVAAALRRRSAIVPGVPAPAANLSD